MNDDAATDEQYSNHTPSAPLKEAERTGDRKPFVQPELRRHADLVDATASTAFS